MSSWSGNLAVCLPHLARPPGCVFAAARAAPSRGSWLLTSGSACLSITSSGQLQMRSNQTVIFDQRLLDAPGAGTALYCSRLLSAASLGMQEARSVLVLLPAQISAGLVSPSICCRQLQSVQLILYHAPWSMSTVQSDT